jgi:heat shock protein 110kDa
MIANDRREKERIDARNALEEFVYDMRGKLQEGGELSLYVDEKDRQHICSQLDDLENWIYEEGESSTREVYAERLRDLHTKTNPIKSRHDEYVRNPQDFDDLGRSIQMANKAVASYRAGDIKYDHLTETEILNVSESAERAQKWLIDAQSKMSRVHKTADPPVKCVDIRHENQTLMTCVNSVLSRPKPKPASPPPAPEQKPSQKADGNGDESRNENQDSFKEDKMDVE